MELSFDYARDRRFFTMGFQPGPYESAPFIRELRFWGVDRVPCPNLCALAALIALRNYHITTVILKSAELAPPVCTALSRHFGVEILPAKYDGSRRNLAGGEKVISPGRFNSPIAPSALAEGAEVLTWMSLDDLSGPLGGLIRTNIDAFDLTESEKNLIVALSCAGKEVGHIFLDGLEKEYERVLHRIGLELIDTSKAT